MGRTATLLAPHVADIVGALEHIHADRPVRAIVSIPDRLSVRCDPQDLEEMLGNLLDNGWRWAGSTIRIEAARDASTVHIEIADDGPGLTDGDILRAIEPGVRLDERGDGHGFGLSITRELAELYGGGVRLEAGSDGGLVARLDLPAA
jgi:signal transduction histidine kinase